MAQSVVDQIVDRLLSQPAFRAEFEQDRRSALRSFALTVEELTALLVLNVPALLAAVEIVRVVSPEPIV